VKNLIADSGKIFATDKPFPVQKESRPPSAYMRATAFPIAFTPPIPLDPTVVPPKSGGLVIKNIFNRSKGAVHVLETSNERVSASSLRASSTLRHAPAPAMPPAKRNLRAV